MPAPRLYLSIKDIQRILNVSYGEAHGIMQHFAIKNQTFVQGRMRRVSVNVFADYVSTLDHTDPVVLRHQIMDAMKGP